MADLRRFRTSRHLPRDVELHHRGANRSNRGGPGVGAGHDRQRPLHAARRGIGDLAERAAAGHRHARCRCPPAVYISTCIRVGTFIASARAVRSLPSGGDERLLRLIDPDGVAVAPRSRLSHPINLAALARSRDAEGQPRLWTLEVLPVLGKTSKGNRAYHRGKRGRVCAHRRAGAERAHRARPRTTRQQARNQRRGARLPRWSCGCAS